jgi:uncharacterized integral membrane protein
MSAHGVVMFILGAVAGLLLYFFVKQVRVAAVQ